MPNDDAHARGHDHAHGPDCDHDHGPPQEPFRRSEPKIGRNDPCHCGSGKKFKKCHGVKVMVDRAQRLRASCRRGPDLAADLRACSRWSASPSSPTDAEQRTATHTAIGVALMVYPYFVSSTYALIGVGVLLLVAMVVGNGIEND